MMARTYKLPWTVTAERAHQWTQLRSRIDKICAAIKTIEREAGATIGKTAVLMQLEQRAQELRDELAKLPQP